MQDYEEIKQIGKGSYGDVFLFKHMRTEDEIADKQIKMEFISDDERTMVFAEEKIMGRFTRCRHPHVVVFLHTWHDEVRSIFHFYMEYCSGGSLETELKPRKTQQLHYTETEILNYTYQIANGLEFIHSKKVIHRDLKPANILKCGDGDLKIADFGVGTVLTHTRSERKTKAGSLAYMAPEVIQGNAHSYECDVWSLGAVAYEMITLRIPFAAKNEHAMGNRIINNRFDAIEHDISRQLETLLTDTMNKDPSARPSSQAISELLTASEKDATKRRLEEYIAQLEQKDALLKSKEAELYNLMAQSQAELKQKDSELEDQQKKFRTQLQNKDAEIKQLQTDLKRKDSELQAAEAKWRKGLDESQAQLKKLQDDFRVQLQSKDAELIRLTGVSQARQQAEEDERKRQEKLRKEAEEKNLLEEKERKEKEEAAQKVREEEERKRLETEVRERKEQEVKRELDRWNKEWEASGEKKSKQYTLLHYASCKGASSAVIGALCRRGEPIEALCTGEYGWKNWTPLHVASFYGHVEVVNALIEHKANIEAKDNDNWTPLHLASYNGQVQVVNALIAHKAMIEANDNYNRTPLHWASRNGHVQVVRLLVNKGADRNAKDNAGRTPASLTSNKDINAILNAK